MSDVRLSSFKEGVRTDADSSPISDPSDLRRKSFRLPGASFVLTATFSPSLEPLYIYLFSPSLQVFIPRRATREKESTSRLARAYSSYILDIAISNFRLSRATTSESVLQGVEEKIK